MTSSFNRRSLVKGATLAAPLAWAAPAVAATAMIPVYAASKNTATCVYGPQTSTGKITTDGKVATFTAVAGGETYTITVLSTFVRATGEGLYVVSREHKKINVIGALCQRFPRRLRTPSTQ